MTHLPEATSKNMELGQCNQVVDHILAPYTSNPFLAGYKNHVNRVISFCSALANLDEREKQKITIAACFHDLGIYTDNTFDYLPPSIDLARAYLRQNGRVDWHDEIELMIDQHHRLRAIPNNRLAEIFRKADLIDFSMGLFKQGVSPARVDEIKTEFPNLGFHRNLVRVAGRWICRHPLNPVPVLKW